MKILETVPSKPGEQTNSAFLCLVGTIKPSALFYMLADHHREFRDLRVVKISVSLHKVEKVEPGHVEGRSGRI